MKFETKIIDEKQKIVRITTTDERWYLRQVNEQTFYVPSVTWICEYYPKGIGFYKWLAQRSWDESEALKEAAGDKGSKVHQAVERLLQGQTIKINEALVNPDTGEAEEISAEEYECVMSFVDWFKKTKPEIAKNEFTVFAPDNSYAGTVDFLCKIKDEFWLVDFKTSQAIWPSHELQISAYKHAIPDGDKIKLGILQLGYKRNKDKFKFTEVEDQFPLFEAARQIWAKETAGVVPLQKDYPLELKLDVQNL